MGRCGEGPTVAVYPDGIWYRGVHAGDAEELVREHLLGDRLVAPPGRQHHAVKVRKDTWHVMKSRRCGSG